jgi:ATP-dependent DNA ligase
MNPAYKPMLATLVEEPFDDKRWVFETKRDGFRLTTEKRGWHIQESVMEFAAM